MLSASSLALALTSRFGVPMHGESRSEPDGQLAVFRPTDLPRTRGFSVNTLIGWRSVDVNFEPATYARQVLTVMAHADEEKRSIFRTFVQKAVSSGAHVTFQINGSNAGIGETDVWPSDWHSLLLKFSKGPMEIETSPNAIEKLVFSWTSRMLGSVLALMTLEPVEPVPTGQAEGGGYQILANRYERSQLNRAACIDFHGVKCQVCGFDFESYYGPVGEGYIEVHHVESLARLAPGTVLNPISDLVPLCSNCHSMAHQRRPIPYSVNELKEMITARV